MAIIFGSANSSVNGQQNGVLTPVEYQCKIMFGRATNVSKHFSLIFQTLTGYARKIASARDKGDDLVDIITSYAESEAYNPSAHQQLLEFTHWMALIQDLRHISANRIMTKIIPIFHKYEETAKTLKTEVKKCQTVSDKRKHSLETLEKIRVKSGETSSLYHATLENYRQHHTETMHQLQVLRLHGKDFEESKLRDLKSTLHSFVISEMIFHCRAVEIYTAAARCLQKWNADDDLQEFLNACDAMSNSETAPLPEGNGPAGAMVQPTAMRTSVSQPALSGNEGREVTNAPVPANRQNLFRAQSAIVGQRESAARPTPSYRNARQMEDSESD